MLHILCRTRSRHIPIIENYIELIQALIKITSLDSKDNKGNTPLHLATEEGSIEVVKLLIAAGANVLSVNDNNETPLFIAVLKCFDSQPGRKDKINFLSSIARDFCIVPTDKSRMNGLELVLSRAIKITLLETKKVDGDITIVVNIAKVLLPYFIQLDIASEYPDTKKMILSLKKLVIKYGNQELIDLFNAIPFDTISGDEPEERAQPNYSNVNYLPNFFAMRFPVSSSMSAYLTPTLGSSISSDLPLSQRH